MAAQDDPAIARESPVLLELLRLDVGSAVAHAYYTALYGGQMPIAGAAGLDESSSALVTGAYFTKECSMP